MCGIAGVLGHPDATLLQRMNQLQQHRGPDENDVWMDEAVGFAHARLSILDLLSSQQPMSDHDGAVMVLNGEIYNHRELRSLHPAYGFTTSGDTEAVLAVHRSMRSKTKRPLTAKEHATWLSSLDGMYALSLWNPTDGQLILARDPMGIKPLVRTMIDGTMLFASEVKAFQAHEGHRPEIDELALAARLVWEYPLDATTLLKGVHQVRPGTVERWSLDEHGQATLLDIANIERQHLNPMPTWDPEMNAGELLETFVEGVQQRLLADVPVGIVLSGGLDSSLVAAVAHEAAERAGQDVPACWTVAESEENPDWVAAEQVAAHHDLTHHQHLLEADAFEKRLPDLAWHGEDADVTVMFFHPLFEHMSNHVKVGLCGQGADELHAGYPRYGHLDGHKALLNQRMAALPEAHQRALLKGGLSPSEGWYQATHDPSEVTADLQNMLNFELEHGQLSNFQLRLVDRHSMAHSLEVRVPFLGRAHRRASYALPMDWKRSTQREEKAALRRAADLTNLPKDIVRRPKLPAGRATAPTMLQTFLDDRGSQIEELMMHYNQWSAVLKGQEELAIGLGLFEALHLRQDGHKHVGRSIDALLTEVISG
ncbi:MAG: asparagine synthase (glutamine-hydrolyzing) [Verrucomicrobiales bacterium]|nr:asparagine synthase (glutamine-hydrolyzing) [Verrucomicrobiales bacterium]